MMKLTDPQLGEAVASEIARHFLLHLRCEQEKSPELIDAVRFDGRSARAINGALIVRLKDEFPDVVDQPSPEYNLFVRWVELNRFQFAYADFAFEAYNIIFYERILSLRNHTEDGRRLFHDITLDVFEKFDTEQTGFSVSFFVRVENNMRELLRNIAYEMPELSPDDRERAWELIFEQSKEYHEVVNEYFERLLRNALDRSEELLHNILPVKVSEELKERGRVQPVQIESATVLFTDFKGFTMLSEQMSPSELVAALDECFSEFDQIIDQHGLEKIKTIGDAYMCAGGLPETNRTHAIDAALAALKMRLVIAELGLKYAEAQVPYWEVRIGFHTGPLTAGVIGKKKFSYDIWGDTVNTASRMESSGAPGRVNCSGAAHDHIKYLFNCEPRGKISAKNKGDVEMFFVNGLRARFSEHGAGHVPNAEFWNVYEKLKNGARLKFRGE